MITVSVLNAHRGLRHAFFTREGGVSGGIYASLNCGLGSRDERENVLRNRELAMRMIDRKPGDLAIVHQAHTVDVVHVEKGFDGQPPVADAMVTNTPGLVLGILTADCAPVLLADHKAGVIGAAHSGWKGAIGGILENTVLAMEKLGARLEDISVAIGPCIAQRSYEVGPEFPAPFLAQDAASESYFMQADRDGHFFFDLPGYVRRRLELRGIGTIQTAPCDTCRDEARFFSYRRATLRGEPDYGRFLSAISLEP